MSERGAVSVLAAGLVSMLLLTAVLALDAGRLVVVRVQAQTAADAAALAAAPVTFASFGASGSPEAEAARFARLNGARLVECDCELDLVWRARTVSVRVEMDGGPSLFGIDSVAAIASAQFDPTVWLGSGSGGAS